MVDSTIERLGGSRLVPLGTSDTALGNTFTEFEMWEDMVLWPALSEKYGIQLSPDDDASQAGLVVTITTPRSSTLRQDVGEAIVVAVKALTPPGVPLKKHIEIRLPSGVTYSAGDYLAVLPLNPKEIIHRAMRRFQIAWDAHINISSEAHTTLPTDVSIPVYDVLGGYVELAQPATRRVSTLIF